MHEDPRQMPPARGMSAKEIVVVFVIFALLALIGLMQVRIGTVKADLEAFEAKQADSFQKQGDLYEGVDVEARHEIAVLYQKLPLFCIVYPDPADAAECSEITWASPHTDWLVR